MNYKLHKLDIQIHNRQHISRDDVCAYLLEKESEGYSASDANNLIYNFKKPVNRKGLPDWRYKDIAINTISEMVNNIAFPNCIIVPAPTSNPRYSANWDSRIDQVVDSIVTEAITVEKILDVNSSVTPAHLGGSRDIDSIKAQTICYELKNTAMVDTIIIVDDVLTTGAHFKAWKELILETYPSIKKVYGLFFALHVWKDIEVSEIKF